MPKYRYEIEFDAEDDEDAKTQVFGRETEFGPDGGAESEFYSIHTSSLEREDGTKV